MSVNPYESPRMIDAAEKPVVQGADPILQLLTEIRDAQCEMLQLQREAMLRQRKTTRFSFVYMFIALAFIIPTWIFSRTIIRPMPVPPARMTPRTVPQFPAAPVPGSASIGQP